ncbi:hypothetical protein RB620_07935 [Paenibacillus sp. LHD-117]|uniref:hypothetical protein n=1 Tax=Paenibacillus sp. LHD-117 TaxID=3071412 RepID=UPI0027E03936|nr:hypothetical protein [Paenibacillus sp. LHD-117]MDQ6419359.1 hypothetical protein [Paenibacillus sp. LHD-117]
MSFQEKKTIMALIGTFLIFGLYCLYVYKNAPFGVLDQEEPFRFWGMFVLVLIPVTIATKIVLHILFSILNKITTNEDEPSFADELDKLIDLKSTRNSHYVFVIGFVLGIGSLAADASPSAMFMIFVGAGFCSEVAGYLSQLYYYRKGV